MELIVVPSVLLVALFAGLIALKRRGHEFGYCILWSMVFIPLAYWCLLGAVIFLGALAHSGGGGPGPPEVGFSGMAVAFAVLLIGPFYPVLGVMCCFRPKLSWLTERERWWVLVEVATLVVLVLAHYLIFARHFLKDFS